MRIVWSGLVLKMSHVMHLISATNILWMVVWNIILSNVESMQRML